MTQKKFALCAQVSAMGLLGPLLLAASPAFAQTTEQAPSTQAAQASDEIVVTAQRRSEAVRDVPISLTVRTAETLEQLSIDTIRDLHVGTPGLRIDRNGASMQPAIRGITTTNGNPGNDANVAIYVDGVYSPNPGANNMDFPDIQQIEVLKGPQGTLFGRNASGGAIRITTLRPEYDFRGQVSAGYGSFDETTFSGFVTGPIIDNLMAGSLAASYQSNEGYLEDLTNNGENTGALDSRMIRGKLLIEPTSNADITLEAHHSRRVDGSLTGQPLRGNTSARGTPGVIIATGDWEVASNHYPRVDAEANGLSATVNVDMGFAALNAITSYSEVNVLSEVESDYTNIDAQFFHTYSYQHTFSQEITLASQNEGAINWLAGVFYYKDDAAFDPLQVVTGGAPFDINGEQQTEAYSGFGELTFDVTDRLRIIAGLRYSWEERTLLGSFGAGAGFPELASKTFDSTTPRLSIRYDLTDTTNVYATYSQGFKSGGYDASSLGTIAFDPEIVDAYEIGLKSQPSRDFGFNASVFYYQYSDQQVQSIITVGSTTLGATTNAAESSIYGAEFEGNWQITDNFSLLGTLSLLHARFESFQDARVHIPTGGPSGLCGTTDTTVDASGNSLIRAPDYTVSLTANYDVDLELGKLLTSATIYASDEFFFTSDNRVSQPSYETLAARVSFEPAAAPNLRFTLWGRNLTDEVVYQGASILGRADGILFAPPRQIGVEVTARF